MEQELQTKLDELDEKIKEIQISVQKTERYLRWTFWGTMIVVVLPLIIMMFALPAFISSYTSALSGIKERSSNA